MSDTSGLSHRKHPADEPVRRLLGQNFLSMALETAQQGIKQYGESAISLRLGVDLLSYLFSASLSRAARQNVSGAAEVVASAISERVSKHQRNVLLNSAWQKGFGGVYDTLGGERPRNDKRR